MQRQSVYVPSHMSLPQLRFFHSSSYKWTFIWSDYPEPVEFVNLSAVKVSEHFSCGVIKGPLN